MASGNEKFTSDANDVEGMVHDVPPNYDETDSKTTASLPNQNQQYPLAHNPSEYTPQQPAQFLQQPPGYPQEQPGPCVDQQQVTQAPVQQNVVQVNNPTMPNDYFAFALFVTLCCYVPCGIVALIKSNEVNSRSTAGDFDGAANSSSEAKCWSLAGLIVGTVTVVILVIIYISI